jgi:hypothetical protein
MDMRKLLEAVTKFAGEPEQKPGDQVRGTDVAKKGSKDHPFKGQLVGDSKDNMLRGLAQVAEDKSLEWELAEAYAKFMEDDLGVEPKRPARKGSRHARGHEPKSGYTTVKEYKKDTDNFTADDIKELEGIKDLATLKERAFALISTPSKKPMKPEKIAWFKSAIERMTSPAAVIKLMWDLLLSGEGQAVIGSRSSMNPNSYRSRFNEEETVEEGWESGPEERDSGRERDPDDAYDDMRQQKADAEAERQQARRPQEQYYTLTGRGPNMEPNYAFPGEYATQDEAAAARSRLMADPKTPNPRDIGISKHTRYLDEAGIPPTGQHRIRSAKKFVSVAKQLGATIQDHGDELTAVDSKGIVIGEFSQDEMVGWIYAPTTNRSEFNEGIESGDPVESAVLNAVQELIQQGHTEVAPEVITNMVVAATSQPFLLKDLVDVNNNSAAVQHYVDSINPTKVKFSNEILTVKNEDPMKDKKQAQNGVAKMAAKAAGRSRLGEASTPLRDREDYQAKNKALQDIQMDLSTSQDPELTAELARRKAELVQQAKQLGISESRAHKIIANKLKQIELQRQMGSPEDDAAYAKHVDSVKKSSAEYIKNTPNTIYKREVDEAGSAIGGSATSSSNTAGAMASPEDAKKAVAATSQLKAATGSQAAPDKLMKALDAASQGKAVSAQDMTALEPMMDVVASAAKDPKLANQFKTLANQARQSQQQAK